MEKYIRNYGLYDAFICNENFCECVVGRNPSDSFSEERNLLMQILVLN